MRDLDSFPGENDDAKLAAALEHELRPDLTVSFPYVRDGRSSDPRWERPCSLMGCSRPRTAHHHHWFRGHLSTAPCRCAEGGEPGTRMSP